MKRFILAFGFLAFVFSCSSNEKSVAQDVTIDYSNADIDYAEQAVETAEVPGMEDGLSLIEGSDCLACHTVDTKVIGPSYHEVAAKYTVADIEMLAQKIIDGGAGNWGEVPMTPHPDLNMDKAKTMVEYILSLKQ
ncbi:MAG: cytochrome C [Weeksellaceae bacterium]|jgi:cytochrome c|nr:cytochrome C [Weeksellaceae bacterium]